jgi:hypothetical protein
MTLAFDATTGSTLQAGITGLLLAQQCLGHPKGQQRFTDP